MIVPGSINPLLLTSAAAAGGIQVSRSLRFNAADSAYLNRTPSVAGNRKIFTFSCWVKLGQLGIQRDLFSAAESGTSNPRTDWRFDSSNNLTIEFNPTGSSWETLTSSAIYRDTSAWYHVVVAVDTTQATSSDRTKVYINNVQQTMTGSYVSQNTDLPINNTWAHSIGRYQAGAASYFDGYLTNVHFIDGQALTPSSFTEVSATTGQLIPKAFSGSYGLVADSTGALPIFNTTGAQGAVKGTGTRTDTNSASIVLAVPMDGTNGGTSFGDQSAVIRGSGSAKTVTVNGNTNTSTAQSKFYGSSGSFDGTGDYLSLSSSADFQIWNSTSWTVECFIYINSLASSFYFFGAGDRVSTTTRVMFSFNSSGNFTLDWDGTSSDSTTTFTTGLSANNWYHLAVVSNGTTCKVYINGAQASTTATLGTSTQANAPISIGVPGLAANPATYNGLNGYIQDFRIYKGVAKYTSNFIVPTPNSFYLQFADNSAATATTLGKDTSGNSNNWTPNNLSVTAGAGNDSLVDTPTSYGTDTGVGGEVRGNYATLNPLQKGSDLTLSNGNLDLAKSSTVDNCTASTIGMTSGKWYFELTITNLGSGEYAIGFGKNIPIQSYMGSNATTWSYADTGLLMNNGSTTSYGSSYTTGDILGAAFDGDNGTLTFYKNGTSQGTAVTGLTQGPYFFTAGAYSSAATRSANFGQRAFAYTAPSGFKALCDTNLGAPLVAKPSTVFDVITYTGTGSSLTLPNGSSTPTSISFTPDFAWLKGRSGATDHALYDAVRGVQKDLVSNSTSAETTETTGLTAFGTNTFTVGSLAKLNTSSSTYVAWAWNAGGSTVSNTAGSITGGAQVRANPSAGFSVVTYTGTGANATVGHGLGVAPGFIIIKNRSSATNWRVYHSALGNTKAIFLSTQGTSDTSSVYWNNTSPTSTVFSIGSDDGVNGNGNGIVSYCFAPVAGYSSFGSYVGNGSSDGPMVWTGFRVRWLLWKRSDSGANSWVMIDAARNTYNVVNNELYANLSIAEGVFTWADFLSNGFKLRSADSAGNSSGATYIYAAFAESPFQYARAR